VFKFSLADTPSKSSPSSLDFIVRVGRGPNFRMVLHSRRKWMKKVIKRNPKRRDESQNSVIPNTGVLSHMTMDNSGNMSHQQIYSLLMGPGRFFSFLTRQQLSWFRLYVRKRKVVGSIFMRSLNFSVHLILLAAPWFSLLSL
jgi:hypothetical protein